MMNRRPLHKLFAWLCVHAAALSLLAHSRAAAAEFTFGSVPGGEPRFSFNGFGAGGMGGFGGGGAAVDNEGYYKVGGQRREPEPHGRSVCDVVSAENITRVCCKRSGNGDRQYLGDNS